MTPADLRNLANMVASNPVPNVTPEQAKDFSARLHAKAIEMEQHPSYRSLAPGAPTQITIDWAKLWAEFKLALPLIIQLITIFTTPPVPTP